MAAKRELLCRVGYSVQRLSDVLLRVSIGQPDIAFPVFAEVRAGQSGDARFVQQDVSKLVALDSQLLDVRKDVEGALGSETVYTRNTV